MFTGIIAAIGTIESVEKKAADSYVRINTGQLDLSDVELGDSIAVNGVCLTAVELSGNGFAADVSGETLSRTTFENLKPGLKVNLEKALTPTTRLGGHLVSGHVDGVGEVISRTSDGRSERFRVKAPANLAKYIAEKGSICVEGISLTVNAVFGDEFELNIVPHTLQETTMSGFKVGTRVNLEVDLLARYLERLLLGEHAAEQTTSGVTKTMLQQYGFIKE